MTIERVKELFNSDAPLAICVGSWKAYNECNNHAYGTTFNGSNYIDINAVESAEELGELLDFIGWSKEEQEELFVQDYTSNCGIELKECDNLNPIHIIEALKNNNIDLEEDGEKIGAIIEASVESNGIIGAIEHADDWYFVPDQTAEEYEEQFVDECAGMGGLDGMLERAGLGWLSPYISIDFEQMAR